MSMRHTTCFLLVPVLLSVVGCAGTRRAFELASDKGTIEAYEEFISEHPYDPLAMEARERIVEIEFVNAYRENTMEAYDDFLSRHHSGSWVDKAKAAKLDLQIQDIKSHGPGDRFVLPFDIGDGYRTEVTFDNGGMSGGDFQWGPGATGRMVASDGSLFTFVGTNRFPDTPGPYQMGSMKAYLPTGLVGKVIVGYDFSPLVFILVRPHGLVHLSGLGSIKLSDGKIIRLSK